MSSRDENLAMLLSMGFLQNRAEKAIFLTKNKGVQEAIDWLTEHQDDADIDEPITLNESDLGGATQENKPPLSEEEKAEAVKKLREMIAAKKAANAVKEEGNEYTREKERREQGKAAQVTSEYLKEQAQKAEIERIKRQKEEDKRAMERLREEIAKDKAERLARMGKAPAPVAAPTEAPAQPTTAKPATEYTECLLQIRLPNGTMLKESFKPTDTIRTVLERVEKVKTDGFYPFQLMTTFPRKTYTPDLLGKTLAEEQLAPRGTMVVTKST